MTNEELAIKIGQGESEHMEQLYKQCKRLLDMEADKYFRQHSTLCQHRGVEAEDLKAVTFFALHEAVQAYCNSDKQYSFNSYLKYPLQNTFNSTVGLRTKRDQNDPLNLCLSLNAPLPGTDEELELQDIITDSTAEMTADVDFQATVQGVFPLVKDVLGTEKQRQYYIIEQMYKHEKTARQIAEERGTTQNTVYQDVRTAFRFLRRNNRIRMYADDVIGCTYKRSGFFSFKNNRQSCVEWAVMKLEEKEGKRCKNANKGQALKSEHEKK
ncbi:MAG: sigma-70 family RNA polymerase sigma factor [Clostridia bacterium]|nr:sigma-70 family RNA polymerase sigma factor [Clostridia bacterium]